MNEFKFYSRARNEIFDVFKWSGGKNPSVVCYYMESNFIDFRIDLPKEKKHGVLLPVLDLELSDGTLYTQGDVIFLTNDDELYFKEEKGREFINYKTAARLPRHIFFMKREELGYWWLYGSDGQPSGHNDDMYPAGWIDNECSCYRVLDNEGRNVNVYTHDKTLKKDGFLSKWGAGKWVIA